ncbi:DUF4184 family protein [Fusobacterium sp. PH5-44]|uniref:DUF4184 family protein n=1 Tax=unclassified Fusobacterium TaxID=2648384 RepID=UPI003D23A23B
MPFTFSHPSIVLPLKKLSPKWFSMTGLIIGSMLPDFEYFIRMRMKSTFSHNIHALWYFHLPIGIIIAFIFHNLIRDFLIDNLPLFLKSRFHYMKNINWNDYFRKKWYLIVYSLVLGTLTHLFWDSFTHLNGYFVKIFPVLKSFVYISGKKVYYFKILQHTSTILGALVIFIFIIKLPKNNNVSKHISLPYWILFLIFLVIVIIIRMSMGIKYKHYVEFIVNIISSGFISLIITSIIYKLKNGITNEK